jgi:hypothetical protein
MKRAIKVKSLALFFSAKIAMQRNFPAGRTHN